MDKDKTTATDRENRDPITGEPGSHPLGTSLGAAGAGAVGMVLGTVVGGPILGAVSAAIAASAGGVVGHTVGEQMNPTYLDVEPVLREQFPTRPYAAGRRYEEYSDAYEFGAAERARLSQPWDDTLEPELKDRWEERWDHTKERTRLKWDEARGAVKDAWHSVERRLPGDADRDGR